MSVFGHHSVGELRDWLSAIEYQTGQLAAAYAAFGPAWQAKDAAGHNEWADDWRAFQARYGAARARAQSAIERARWEVGVPDSVIPVEDEWQAVLHALARSPGTTGKGDFQDLNARLVVAQGRPVDMSKTPQPTAVDADLSVYKAADTAIRVGENAARTMTGAKMSPVAKLLLGGSVLVGIFVASKVVLR